MEDSTSPSIQGYKTFTIWATKIDYKDWISGELAVFIIADLKVEVETLESKYPKYIQTLLIKKQQIGSFLFVNA